MSAAAALLAAARAAGATVATAESCTAGLVAATIADPPGASDILLGGIIAYANAAKTALLGVSEATIAAHGAVSEEVAREMAQGARTRLGADHAVAVTGIAGPGGSETKPEGRVCFAVAGPAGVTSETVEFGARGRDAVRRASCDHALGRLLEAVSADHKAAP